MTLSINWPQWFDVVLGSGIVAAIVQTALVAGAVLLVIRCFPRIPASWRYALLLIALCKFAVPPHAALPTGLFSRVAIVDTVPSPGAVLSEPDESRPQDHGERSAGVAATAAFDGEADSTVLPDMSALGAGVPFDEVANARVGNTPKRTEKMAVRPEPCEPCTAPAPSTAVLLPLLAGLYATGAGAGLLYLMFGLFQIRRWRQQARRIDYASEWMDDRGRTTLRFHKLAVKTTVAIVPSIRVPMAVGLFRPAVLLPASFETRISRSGAGAQKMRAVIAHELVHHARGDLWVNLAQKILLCVWWFHPMMWRLDRALRETREECCDDAVLNAGISDGTSYAKLLLEVAVLSRHSAFTSPVAIAMARPSSSLAQRIRRATDDSLSHRGPLSRLGWVVSICAALLILPGIGRPAGSAPLPPGSTSSDSQRVDADSAPQVTGRDAPDTPGRLTAYPNQLVQPETGDEHETVNAEDAPSPSVELVVRDAQGDPIPGARVWRGGNDGGKLLEIDPTDADGKTSASGNAIPLSPFGHEMEFLAWDGGDRFGMTRVETVPLQTRAEITCRRHVRTPLTVHDPDGEPLQGAKVAVRLGRVDGEDTWIPDALREELQAATDRRGIANALFVDPNSYLVIDIVSDDYGTQSIHVGKEDSKSGPLQLRSTGAVVGRVNFPTGVTPSDLEGDYVFFTDSGGAIRTTPAVQGIARVEPDADGRFKIPHMVAGPIRGHLRPGDGQSRWQIRPAAELEVRAGGTTSVSLDVEPARHVVGTVVDRDSGKGVPGVIVLVDTRSEEIRRLTDKSGRFSFFMLPGQTGSVRYFPPDPYYITRSDFSLGGNELKIPKELPRDKPGSGTTPSQRQLYQMEPVEVERGTTVRGLVVDENGDRVDEASVWISWSDSGHRFNHDVRTETGADGSFTIEGVPSNQPLKLAAAKKGMLLGEMQVDSAPLKPLRFTVEPLTLAAFRIRVVDSAGKPTKGVRVEIHRSTYSGPHMGGFGRAYESQTDASGHVTTEQSYPAGKTYTIKVFAEQRLLIEKQIRAAKSTEVISTTLIADRD